MKKIVLLLLTGCLLVLAAGCRKDLRVEKEVIQTENPIEKETNKPINKPKDESTREPEITPEPTLEPTPEPMGEIITNGNEIVGMAIDILENMTLEEKIGQMFLVELEALDSEHGSYYEFRELTEKMMKSIEKYHIGGIALFGRNIETREQTIDLIQNLQTEAKYPMFISVDEEGGEVARIANNDNMQTTKFPTMEEIGTSYDTEYAYNMGCTIGSEIKQLGFNLDFAPVADVNTNDLNKEIGSRSFGNDAKLVSKMVRQVVKGLQEQNISATLKHFPGHGNAGEDTHEGAVNIDNDLNRLRKVDFVPFKEGIKEGVDFIMISHVSISRVTENTVPATLSPLVMETMLRSELGFDGIIITDAMNMKSITDTYNSAEAAVQAIKAGADIVLMPENFKEAYQAVLECVKSGELEEKRINQSVQRILEKKIQRGLILSNTKLIQDVSENGQNGEILPTNEIPMKQPEAATAPAVSSKNKTKKPKKSKKPISTESPSENEKVKK